MLKACPSVAVGALQGLWRCSGHARACRQLLHAGPWLAVDAQPSCGGAAGRAGSRKQAGGGGGRAAAAAHPFLQLVQHGRGCVGGLRGLQARRLRLAAGLEGAQELP